MLLDILTISAGIALLLVSGELIVRYASLFAGNLGISTLVVGLTVVAFGTSAPELAVNLLAALRGSGGISFGNIVGSNIFNLLLVAGASSFITPFGIPNGGILDLMVMVAFSLILILFAWTPGFRIKKAREGNCVCALNSLSRPKEEENGLC